jgi:sulfoxide reductase heme-binding subunit YedZ
VSTQLTWYVARSAGIVAWVLLTASVLWGLTMTTRFTGRRVKRAWLLDLHRFLGGLAAIFTGVHVGAILLDSYVHFDLTSVLLPFASSWKPVAVAWGIVAAYLLLAVELTSLARARLPRRLWRATHFASFPLFFFATVHGITAGTDAHLVLFRAAAVIAIAAVTALTAMRVMRDTKPQTRKSLPLVHS